MNRPARIVLFALEYAASRELLDLLAGAGHDVLAVRSVDEAAGLWLGGAPDLIVVDAPAPDLCLRRLERRLGEDLLGWRQPALLILPAGAARAAPDSEEMLASCLARPLHFGVVAARVQLLLQLGRALRRLGGRADPSSPPPGPARAGADHDELLALLGRRDTGDADHSRRVARLCCALAERLGLPEAARMSLDRAALWHDLGKLALHPQLLRKPARLTDAEKSVVRTHATWGAALVRDLLGDESAAESVLHHHERADGSGYLGLSAAQAPLPARILALAECWDAMTSAQVFRRATPPEDVLSHLRSERSVWDPAVLAALEAVNAG